ncbi:MAG: hypothetical protein K0R41_607 [Geminicoccaceae bacterium]|jgi:hypothetical protein|nr:hypothetical protein [Geminicoccaceae bacterium]
MIGRSRMVGLALLSLLAGAQPLAAAGEDPDWPCVQRLVAEIAPGMIWAGPPLESIDGEPRPAIDALASELAARRVPLEDAEAKVERFAGTLEGGPKDEQLTRLFARTLEDINRDRSSIIQGIRKFARGQRTLAERINARNDQLSALGADQVALRDALLAEQGWDLRVYEDRRSSLGYLCEQPVLLEQRAFALARTIAGHLQ